MQEVKGIYIAMPLHDGRCHFGAAAAMMRASQKHPVTCNARVSSLATACFNGLWCNALDHYDQGNISHFAMIHSDVEAPAGWLDILLEEMNRHNADLCAAHNAIKDHRGLTSTAIDLGGQKQRRLTNHEVFPLEVITQHDYKGPLLVNTGLWCVKLGPWCDDLLFTVHDWVVKRDGKRMVNVEPEDWNFSRQVHAKGKRIIATNRIKTRHHGGEVYTIEPKAHNWDTDLEVE